MSPQNTEQARWFTEEVHPHEPALRAYLRNSFPDATDVDDLVQESYMRILRARKVGPITNAKAYLFATARNVALAIFRRPRIFSNNSITDYAARGILEEGPDAAEICCTKQDVGFLLDAIDALPSRCREIFILRKLQRVSQKDIAERLGLSEQTVQVQIARGAKKCAQYLRFQGVTGRFQSGPT